MGESDFECILWDFGGVFTGSPFYSIDNYAGHLGVKPQQLIELVLGYGLEDGDHHWHRLERGEITMAEALEEIEALISASGIQGFAIRDFFKSMGGENDKTQEMFDAVRRYKDLGITQLILSNNIREFSDINSHTHFQQVEPGFRELRRYGDPSGHLGLCQEPPNAAKVSFVSLEKVN